MLFWYFITWGAVGVSWCHPETQTASEKGNKSLTLPFLCHWVLCFPTLNCWLIVLPLKAQQQLCRVGDWAVGQQPCSSTTEAGAALWNEKFTFGTRQHSCFSGFFTSEDSSWLMWWASAVSIPAAGLPAPGAVLLLVGRSKDLWCSFYSGNPNTVVPRICLVCLTSGPKWLHVFQMCLKVNLHSCAFSSSCSYFLGTSACCQFTLLALLVELMPLCHRLVVLGARQLVWPCPSVCRCAPKAASPTQPPGDCQGADWGSLEHRLTPGFIEVKARFAKLQIFWQCLFLVAFSFSSINRGWVSETTFSACTGEAAEETKAPAVFLPRSQHADIKGEYHSLLGTHYIHILNSCF